MFKNIIKNIKNDQTKKFNNNGLLRQYRKCNMNINREEGFCIMFLCYGEQIFKGNFCFTVVYGYSIK